MYDLLECMENLFYNHFATIYVKLSNLEIFTDNIVFRAFLPTYLLNYGCNKSKKDQEVLLS